MPPLDAGYEVFSVFDLFGEPVLSGIYKGGVIHIPMGTVPAVQPDGDPQAMTRADDPGPAFGAFILRSDCILRTL